MPAEIYLFICLFIIADKISSLAAASVSPLSTNRAVRWHSTIEEMKI
jgi:hypothetical protein